MWGKFPDRRREYRLRLINNMLLSMQADTTAELDALLDRAFKGEL